MKGVFAKAVVVGFFAVPYVACSVGGNSPTPPTTKYALTVQVSPSGWGTVAVSPSQAEYASGTIVTLTATAASGYAFSNWTGDATGTTNPTTVTMNGNKTVTANFIAGPTYTLTVQVSPSGGGTVALSPSQAAYASGTIVTLTATAASGYAFSNWTGDATGTANPTTVTMNGNKTVTANFIAGPTYTLTVQVSPSGGGTVALSPNKTHYPSGTIVTLTATAASGYAFSDWTGDATGTTNPTTVTMNGNKTVTANFIAGPTYALTVQVSPSGGGTVAVSPSQAEYASGTIVSLTATAASGYAFSNWTGDATGTANPTTVTMNGNKTVTADFAFYKYFAYVVNETNPGTVSAYMINSATGALTAIATSPFVAGSNPYSIAVDPAGKFAYVANEYSNDVSGYTINSTTGVLTAMGASPFAAGSNPYSVAVDPTGKFVYVANEYSNDVSGYTINSTTGALTAMGASPFTAGSSPVFVAIDPTGKFVYVANEYSNDVSGYTINSTTGALTAMGASPFAAGSNSYSIAVDPTGKFAYVANEYSNDVSGYTINSTTGALTAMGASPFAAGSNPYSVAVDPTGKFAYVANAISFNVSAYTINSSTGALTAISGSPFATVANAVFIAVDPTGKFAYVANFISSNISAYSIDSITGALTAIASSPFGTGAYPCSIATIRIRQ
jgi:uncharacterized repeat protein (TIGR02543 family)